METPLENPFSVLGAGRCLPPPLHSTFNIEWIRNMCLSLVAESEKMRTQSQQGKVLKPVKCKVCREVKTNKKIFFFKISQHMVLVNDAKQEKYNGDFKKIGDIKKNSSCYHMNIYTIL